MTDPTPAEALKAEDDAPEIYEVSRLPLLLREHVDMVLACEAEPHVIEDARAIVAQAADYIAAALPTPDAGEVRTYREGVQMACAAFEEAIAYGYQGPQHEDHQCPHGIISGFDCIACYDEALTASIAAIRKLP